MSTFVNPFGSTNPTQGQAGSSPGKFVNPFAGYNPPQQTAQPQAAPVKQIPSSFGLGDIVPKNILSGVTNFLDNAEKAGENAISSAESFGSTIGKSLNTYRLALANSTPVTKQIGDILNSLGTAPLKGRSLGNTNSDETYSGDTPKDIASKILDILPSLIGGEGQAVKAFSGTKAAISAATQAGVQIAAGQSPHDIITNLPFGLMGGFHEGKPMELTPAEAKAEVINTDLAKTPLGNEIMKTALNAKAEDTIKITPDPESNLKTQTGFPVKVEIANKAEQLQPETFKSEAEKNSFTQLTDNPDKIISDYVSKFGNVVGADEAKTMFKGYSDQTAGDYHKASTILRDMVFDKQLEEQKGKGNNTVLYTAGGTGAGKTESLTHLPNKGDYPIVYDSTFSDYNTAQKVIDKAAEHGYNADIVYISADPVSAWDRVIARGRQLPADRHIDYYVKSLENIKKIYDKYKNSDNVSFNFIDNSGQLGSAKEIPFEQIAKMSYNKDELSQKIQNEPTKATEPATSKSSNQTNGTKPEQGNGSQVRQANASTEGTQGKSTNGRGEPESSNNKSTNASTPSNGIRPQLSNTAKSKLSSDIETRLNTEFKDLPGYEKMNMKEQASKAVDLLSSDYDKAKAIAMGEQNPPQGLRSGAVFTAVREQAFQNGDVQTLHDLAKTNLAGEAGQALKSFDTFRPGDPVKAIHDIIQSRTKAIEDKTGKTVNAAIKDEVAKMDTEVKKTASKPNLAEFIKGIQC